MIVHMTTTGRRQRRYDHRLRDLVQHTGDMTIATDLGGPRFTARGWIGIGSTAVVSLDVTNLKALELQQEVLELRGRVKKLTALLRLALPLLRTSGFTSTHARLPDGRAKVRILRAIDRARACVCRCRRFCGSCDCRRLASMPGDGCGTPVRLTISRPVRTRHPIESLRPRYRQSRTW